MKKKIKIWIKAWSYFFNFRKPAFREFNCIDLVAYNKSLFLMAWDTDNARRITVNPGRHVYNHTSGAVIIGLLPATVSVDISIRNCWRRTPMKIQLKHVALDKESFDSLIANPRLFNRLTISDMQPGQFNFFPEKTPDKPVLRPFYFKTNINPRFKYKNLNQI